MSNRPIPIFGQLPDACAGCPLACKPHREAFPFVSGDGPLSARLVVVLDRPEEADVQTGIPASGPAGKDLDIGLKGTRGLAYVTAVRKCRPVGDETPEERTASIAHCTKAYLSREMIALTDAKAQLLVGADALEWGIGLRSYTWTNKDGQKIHEPGILQYSGSVFTNAEVSNIRRQLAGVSSEQHIPSGVHTVVVTLHPDVVRHGQRQYRSEILTNIVRAMTAANSPPLPLRADRQEIDFIHTSSPLEPLRTSIAAIDIETPKDQPSKIELCCVASSPAYVQVFDWTDARDAEMRTILSDPNLLKVGHNFGYDVAAFIENNIKPAWPLADTIIAAARIWPPIPQKQLLETTKEHIPVKRLGLDRVTLRLLTDVVYWKRPETRATRAFYAAAFPNIPPWRYGKLYNALDGIYTYRVWLAELELLKSLGLLERFSKIDMPAFLPMIRMEQRGLLVDELRRKTLQADAIAKKTVAEVQIAKQTQEYHTERRLRVLRRITKIGENICEVQSKLPACEKHPTYTGLTRRRKNACCQAVFQQATESREKINLLRVQYRAEYKTLDRIGDAFDSSKPDHWRWLLFSEDGLNRNRPAGKKIRPVSKTLKLGLPQIDDRSFELLQRRHPDVGLFKLKIKTAYAKWLLSNPLAVKVDPATGRAHTKFSIHRAATARYVSGTDREDADKLRYAVAGNQQNAPISTRSIYVAPPGYLILAPDYSQIEARVTAWRARETVLLDAWARGEDIHTRNAVVLAEAIGVKLDPADARRLPFPYDPQGKSYRDVGKVQTHAMDYGEMPRKMAKLTGMPFEVCRKIHAGYFEAYPRLASRMREVEAEALETGWLTNAFGLRLGPFRRANRGGMWTLFDREEAFAAHPQSDVGDMIKIVSVELDKLAFPPYNLAELVTTMHDSFWLYVSETDVVIAEDKIKHIMERPWPELGTLPGYGIFRCPVEIALGKNGAEYHVHDEWCEANGCDGPENPEGLVKRS